MTLIYFILLLSIIVIIHEFGHLLAAKAFNVYCQEFSVGMGPEIYRHKGKETDFVLRLLPLGGFVAMAGDNDNALETDVDETDIPFERTLKGISPIKRIIVMLAGVFNNFLLGLLIISMILLANGSYQKAPEPRIASIAIDSPAEIAGFKENDLITKVAYKGTDIKPIDFSEMSLFIASYDGDGELVFTVERDGSVIDLTVKPLYKQEENRYLIGVTAVDGETIKINFFNSFYYGFLYCISLLKSIFISLIQLLHGLGLDNLSGPVGIYQATGEAASYGLISYLVMMAVISLNIGLMNLLPLPILDGGRVLLTLIEMIIGHPLDKKFEEALMTASLILMLFLFIFTTYRDILRIF